jgi:WTAP/Mum2p family
MKNVMDEQSRVINKQRDELEALAFSPTSSVGLELVQRCSALKAENNELGQVLHNGTLEKYKMEIALQNKLINELQVSLKGNANAAFNSL